MVEESDLLGQLKVQKEIEKTILMYDTHGFAF